jgi:hypothetical protein
MDHSKLQQFIESQLGELHSNEKDEIQSIVNVLTALVNQSKVNEDSLLLLKNAEDSIRILRDKLVNRYINLLKTTK